MKEASLTKKIYYHDTDCGGVVYYANYLKYLEEGRTEALSELGVGPKIWFDAGALFVVARIEIDYKEPARYQDTIKIISRIEKVGKASIRFNQEVRKNDSSLVQAYVVLACVDKNLKPKPIPANIKEALV